MQEIDEIKAHVDVEIEAFIHGAMCSSYSGRCVFPITLRIAIRTAAAAHNRVAGNMIYSRRISRWMRHWRRISLCLQRMTMPLPWDPRI